MGVQVAGLRCVSGWDVEVRWEGRGRGGEGSWCAGVKDEVWVSVLGKLGV